MISTIEKYLSVLPYKYEKGVEYYYRRGNRFFFRTVDKSEKICFLCSPKEAENCKKILIKGKIYKTGLK